LKALEPLRGPAGKKYEEPARLYLTGVEKRDVEALETLGDSLPEHPTDKRQTNAALRGLRHLISAYGAGGARLTGQWRVNRREES